MFSDCAIRLYASISEPGRIVREHWCIFGLHEELIGIALFSHLDLRKHLTSVKNVLTNEDYTVWNIDADQGMTP